MSYEVYVSVDVEATGPVPGAYSMVSLGATAVACRRGRKFDRFKQRPSFYAQIRELVDARSIPEAEKVARSAFDPKMRDLPPEEFAEHYLDWLRHVKSISPGAQLVFVAYPLGFDWAFSHYYLEVFGGVGQDPFGFSRALDIKTFYAAKAGVPIGQAVKGKMPGQLTRSKQRHTHNALDDAHEQGDLFCNIVEWDPLQASTAA